MNKEHETRITIRFPSSLADEIKHMAQQEARSINSEVVHAVREYLNQKRREAKRHGHESV